MKHHILCLALSCLLAGCVGSGYSTVADKQLERDILKTILVHGMGTNRDYNYIGVSKKPLQGQQGTVCELWSIREKWTDRFSHYQVTMIPDGNGETDLVVQEVDSGNDDK